MMRLFSLLLILILSGVVSEAQDFNAYVAKLDKNLQENIVKFWVSRCLDTKNGGYLINFDQAGRPSGQTNKMIVTQARMVWLFSRLAREGYQPATMLDAADLGYRFLRDKMWDRKNGGVFWGGDGGGKKRPPPDKHPFWKAFSFFSLFEYSMGAEKTGPLPLSTR